jgi:hypothetical protein
MANYIDNVEHPEEKEAGVSMVSDDAMDLEPIEFEPGDTLGKSLALITQVSIIPRHL